MAATINRTNIAMLSREMRNNDWRINGLERKLDALNAKLNDLLEEGGDGGDDNGGSGGDNTGGGSGGKLTFTLNENIRYITSGALNVPKPAAGSVWSVYTTTQTFNGTPTAIDSVDAIYLVDNGTNFGSSHLDEVMGGDWRFLSSDYTVRVGDMLYTSDGMYNPPYSFATMKTENGSPRTIFTAYSQGEANTANDSGKLTVRTIGTPAAIRNSVRSKDGTAYVSQGSGGVAFTLTTDYFATASLLEEYKSNGTLYVKNGLDGTNFTITDDMQLFDTVLSDIYVVVMPPSSRDSPPAVIKAFEVSYH